MYGLLNYYRPADNLSRVKGLIEGLRRSCALTLAFKHKKSIFWSYNAYGEDISLKIDGRVYALPSPSLVSSMAKKFLVDNLDSGFDIEAIMKKFRFRDHLGSRMFTQCAVSGCRHEHVQIHHVRKLEK